MPDTKRIIRIDINSDAPLYGKTTLAAVIAKAVKDQFPDQHVEVLSQERDFLIRAQDLAMGTPLKIAADVVQIVDINANPQPLREGALFQTTIVDFQELSPEQLREKIFKHYENDVINYPEQPYALDALVTDAVTNAVKAHMGPDAALTDRLLGIIFSDPKYRQAAEEFQCDRGDQYEWLTKGDPDVEDSRATFLTPDNVDTAERDADSREDR